jgi:hypothetical protein
MEEWGSFPFYFFYYHYNTLHYNWQCPVATTKIHSIQYTAVGDGRWMINFELSRELLKGPYNFMIGTN